MLPKGEQMLRILQGGKELAMNANHHIVLSTKQSIEIKNLNDKNLTGKIDGKDLVIYEEGNDIPLVTIEDYVNYMPDIYVSPFNLPFGEAITPLTLSSDISATTLSLGALALGGVGAAAGGGGGGGSSTPEPNTNTAPVAVDDAITVTQDTLFTSSVDLDSNDTDVDGDTLSVVAGTYTTTEGGTLVLASDGSYSYTPASGFTGTDTVDYTVTDGNLTDVGTLSINVSSSGDTAPVANDDAATVDEDSSDNVITVLTNDTDADGDTLSVTAASALHGTVSINGDGTLSYTPDADFSGTDTITYTLSDGNLTDDTGTVTVTVTGSNDAPVISGDTSGSGDEDTTITGTLSATDVDGMTDGTYYSVTSDGSSGTATIDSETGAWSYTPGADFNGSDSFTVTITDDDGNTTTQAISVTVNAVNDAPVISGDTSGSGDEDNTITGTLSATDVDGMTDGTYYSVTSDGSSGTATIDSETGAWSYTPGADFNGSDSFTVTITDDDGNTTTQAISVTVNAVNDAPVISGDTSGSGDEDTTITGTLSATDVDGMTDGTYYSVTSDGSSGTATIDSETGAWSYTPGADFNGSDSFTVTITDDDGNTTTQAISVTVNAVNDAPVISGDTSGSGDEDTTITGTLSATDVDGMTDGTYYSVTSDGSSGTATIDSETGAWSYTPGADFNGSDSFTVTITDDDGNTTTQAISVTVNAVNDAPVISGDTSGSGDEDNTITGTLSATDVDGMTDGTYYSVTSDGSSGTATIDSETGAWSYTPGADFNGSDSFTVTITDDDGNTTTQAISVTVNAVNDAPVISGDTSGSGDEDTTITGTLSATDVDGMTDGTYYSVTSDGSSGTATIDSETGAWSYTPGADFNGSDSFTVTITDDDGNTTTQAISVTVNAVNDAPVISGDTSGSGDEDTTITGTLSATDVDGMTDGTYYSVTSDGSSGTATIDSETGAWSYTPGADFNGSDSFTVTITDDDGNTTTQAISVTVNAVNDAPVISGDTSGSGDEDNTITGTLSATDVDGMTDGTYYSVTSDGSSGTATIDSETGAWSYTPGADFNGSDSFTVTITDDGGNTTTQAISVTVNAVNDAPVISGDTSGSGDEDNTITGTLSATDVDGMTDGTYYSVTSDGSSGTATIDSETGAWSYTPGADFNGSDSFTVTITDDGGNTTTQAISVTVNAVNDAPVISGDTSGSGDEDNTITGTLSATDVDGMTDGTYYSVTSDGSSGTATIDSETGAWSYTPGADFNGSDSFTVTITDDDGNTTTQAISVTVNAVNDAPVISGDTSGSGDEDTTITGTLSATDVDGMTDGTYYSVTSDGSSGTATIDSETGAWSYTPGADFNGSDSFTVTITDDDGNTTTQAISVTVNAVNDAPIANDDAITVTQDTLFTSSVDLDSNDTDVDGDTLSVVAGTYTTTEGGTLVLASDGSYSYTPASGFTGTDTVDYTVTDGNLTDVGTLSINVSSSGDTAPVANDDAATVDEDSSDNVITVLTNDTDADGDTLSVTAASALHGTVSINGDGTLSYTPDADFSGTDTITYTLSDGNLTDDTGTVTVTVTGSNDAPVAVDDAVTVTENTLFTSSVDLDSNDTDVDGDTLSVVAGTYTTTEGGTLVLASDGSYTYTPPTDFTGADTVDYTVTDGSLTDIGTLTINVSASGDTAPVAVDDAVTVTENTLFTSSVDLDSNDTDVDGDTLSVVAGTYTTTEGGTLVLASDGSYTYTPPTDFTGADTVDYTVTDGSLTDIGTLTINVSASGDTAPVAVDDAVTVTENTLFTSSVDLDSNDTDVDGDTLSVVAGTYTTTEGGTLVLASDGSYTYTPPTDFTGADTVDYTVTDGSLTDIGTLTINVSASGDTAPIAVDDAVTVTENTLFTSSVDLDSNDTDVDGDTLSVVAGTYTTTEGGTLVLASDGSYTYTPPTDFTGADTVDYTVTDGSLTDIGTLTINVSASGDTAPVAVDDAVTVTENTLFTSSVDLDSNDTDVDGDTLSVVAGTYTTTEGGTLVLASDGSYTYTPPTDFTGADTVDYTVTDGSLTDIGTLTINVSASGDTAPVAVDDAVTVTENTLFTSSVDLDSNDTDVDGDTLSVVAGTYTTTEGGTLVLASDGSYTYTPPTDFTGADTVDYTVTDGSLTDIGTLTINVSASGDTAPVAVDDAVTVTENTLFTSSVDLDSNDTDVDGDTLSVVAGTYTTTEGGTLVLASDGSYTYTPPTDFTGADTVDYTVTDGSLTD